MGCLGYPAFSAMDQRRDRAIDGIAHGAEQFELAHADLAILEHAGCHAEHDATAQFGPGAGQLPGCGVVILKTNRFTGRHMAGCGGPALEGAQPCLEGPLHPGVIDLIRGAFGALPGQQAENGFDTAGLLAFGPPPIRRLGTEAELKIEMPGQHAAEDILEGAESLVGQHKGMDAATEDAVLLGG